MLAYLKSRVQSAIVMYVGKSQVRGSRDDDEDLKMERSSEAKPVTTDWADPKIPISQFPAGLLAKARM